MTKNYIFSRTQKKAYGVNYVKVEDKWIEFTDLVNDNELNSFDPRDTQVVVASEYVLPTRTTRHKGQPVGIFINGRLLVLYSDQEIPDEYVAAVEALDGKPDEEVIKGLMHLKDTLNKYRTQTTPSDLETLLTKTMHETKRDYKKHLDEIVSAIDDALDQNDVELFNKLTAKYKLVKAEM